jgi:hypothetical protein
MTLIEIDKLQSSDRLNYGEKELLDWQYHRLGDFSKGLWQAISHADLSNRARLALGFPLQVQAYIDYTVTGRLTRKFEAIIKDRGFAIAIIMGHAVAIFAVNPDLNLKCDKACRNISIDNPNPTVAALVNEMEDSLNITVLNWSPVQKRFIL